VSLLVFGFNTAQLGKALVNRVGQCVMTCPTTACFDGLRPAEESVKVGGLLRFFGDGHQASKKLDGRRYWRVPVMDGEFLCEDTFGVQRAVAGGNFLILATDQAAALGAAEAAVGAIRAVPGVILPFPGGVVRSGSKVGSRYKALRASTNEEYCPTLRGHGRSRLPADVHAVYEIVIDGLGQEAVEAAMRVGVRAACGPGVVQISAGNYGGKLGQYPLHLHKILGS
jgi:formylmethanofuran--tetrahydromethanopterin N-formyltransferase